MKKTRLRTKCLLCTCLFGALALSMGCQEPPKKKSPVADGVSVKPTSPAPKKEPVVLFTWPKEASRFDIEFSSELAASNGASLMTFKLVAQLDVMATEDGKDTRVVLALVNVQLTLDGAEDAEKVALLQAEMGQPVLGFFNEGRLQKMQFSPGVSSFSVGIWRSFLSYLQIADSKTGEVPFEVVENDGNGEYRAAYSKGSGGAWQKKKLRYTKSLWSNGFSSQNQKYPEPVLLSSAAKIVVQENKLQQILAEDRLKVAIAGAGNLVSTTEFVLKSSDDAASMTAALQRLPSKMKSLRSTEPFLMELPIDGMDAQRMEGLTFEDVLDALTAKAKDPNRQKLWQKKNDENVDSAQTAAAEKWTEDWSKYFSALPAFFRQQPETIKRAEKEIRKGSPAARSLIGGLASSGVGEAQKVLLKLALDEKLDETMREDAVRNLVQCNRPTLETAKAVQAMGSHPLLSRYGMFGTGIMARTLSEEGQQEEGGKLVQWLLAQLDQETDVSRRRDIFSGLSNSADESIIPAMKKILVSENTADRVGALGTLRLMTSAKVDDILAQHMDEALESSAAVRKSAVSTAARRERKEPLLSMLILAAKSDSDKKVKREARRVLFGWSRDLPELKQILEDMAAADEGAALK